MEESTTTTTTYMLMVMETPITKGAEKGYISKRVALAKLDEEGNIPENPDHLYTHYENNKGFTYAVLQMATEALYAANQDSINEDNGTIPNEEPEAEEEPIIII